MKIALIGDHIEDVFIYGSCNRINPEGPYPLVQVSHTKTSSGGAGNVYENMKSLGLPVEFYAANRFHNTSRKTRVVVDGRVIFRIDEDQITNDGGFLKELERKDLHNYQYVILSDYNKGSLASVEKVIEACNNAGCCVIVDPKQSLHKYRNAYCVKPNRKEFEDHYGVLNEHSIRDYAEHYNHKVVIVTLGKDGVMYYDHGKIGTLEAESQEVSDVTGAGDCFLAAFVYGLVNGRSIEGSIKLGNTAAGVSVKKLGTYVLKKSDLVKTVVFTNGCFDVIHYGHIEMLMKSKELGDYLIVGINSDESVKRLKGTNRPINNEYARKKTIEALKFVDEVVIFGEDTPYELIKRIKPDIITKGGDYKMEDVVGNDLAIVKIISRVDGYSTTEILEKI